MNQTLRKYAEDKTEMVFLKGWEDDYQNLLLLFQVDGKRFSFLGSEGNPTHWAHCFGIGSHGPEKTAPAGHGSYLIGNDLDQGYSKAIGAQIKEIKPKLERLQNKNGGAWVPKNEEEKKRLAKLIDIYAGVNATLRSFGITYTEGDRIVYGRDLISKDILAWIPLQTGIGANSWGDKSPPSTSGNTQNTINFIEAFKVGFKNRWGRDLYINSTFRSPLEQAQAMQFPIRDGTYNSLYKFPEAQHIKELINDKKFEEAAEVIKGTKLGQQSHMAGRAFDVPFSNNGLSPKDYHQFNSLVKETSKQTGIGAKLGTESVSHFHVGIDR